MNIGLDVQRIYEITPLEEPVPAVLEDDEIDVPLPGGVS